MPRLTKISLTQFKNYQFASFPFSSNVVGICGLNGKGKTNLLDAIYYLCFTKSYFSKTDQLNTGFNQDGFRLEGLLEAASEEGLSHIDLEDAPADTVSLLKPNQVVCIFRGAGKKEFLLDGVPYTRYSEHIGKYPCVMVAPDDIALITGGSEERRKYLDTLLSQLNAAYLQQLITYNKILQQRNSLLKRFAETGRTDWALLEVLDEQLVGPGISLHAARQQCTRELIPLVQQFYRQIANNEETVDLQYESQLNALDFNAILNNFREKDFLLQRTNGGPHKDDLLIRLNGQVFKNIASQGQRKSLLFALKLAEFQLLKASKGFAPLLLLDDVFEKLDQQRMQQLLQWVCTENDGQVFITDTHRERLEQAFLSLGTSFQIIEL